MPREPGKSFISPPMTRSPILASPRIAISSDRSFFGSFSKTLWPRINDSKNIKPPLSTSTGPLFPRTPHQKLKVPSVAGRVSAAPVCAPIGASRLTIQGSRSASQITAPIMIDSVERNSIMFLPDRCGEVLVRHLLDCRISGFLFRGLARCRMTRE